LQYQLSACASTKSVMDVAWKSYGLSQSKGSLPVGPIVIMTHMASVWVPFTNQAKEAIADYDEIRKEFKLALQEAGRKLGSYLKKKQAAQSQAKRRNIFNAYIEEVVRAYVAITKKEGDPVRQALLATSKKKTELAEQLEAMKAKIAPEEMEGTLVIGEDGNPIAPSEVVEGGTHAPSEESLTDASQSEAGGEDSEVEMDAAEVEVDTEGGDDLAALLPKPAKLHKPRGEKTDFPAEETSSATLNLFGEDDII